MKSKVNHIKLEQNIFNLILLTGKLPYNFNFLL